jgi:tRNA (guanosine-2'-O-)-methyltransferase
MNLRKKRFSEISIDDALTHFSQRITPERLQRLTDVLSMRSNYVVPVMEDLFQEQNAGAIVRTAECCGFQEVGIIERNNIYKLASGIAKGAQKWVDVSVYDAQHNAPMIDVVQAYKNRSFRLVGACPHSKGYTAETLPLNQPIALFFGAEKKGLHDDLRNQMDDFVAIPMRGFTESYNVSVSAAIILQTIRQRLEVSKIPFLLSEEERKILLLEWVIRSIPKGEEVFSHWSSKGASLL